MIGDEVILRHASELALVDSDRRVVVMHLGRLAEPARILAETAAMIWRAVDGVRTRDEIVRSVAEKCGVDFQFAAADIRHFLEELLADGLVVESRAGNNGGH